jgi:hypothetical protein
MIASAAASTWGPLVEPGPPRPTGAIVTRSASTRRRSRGGNIRTTFDNARTDDSSMPATAPPLAARNPTAMAMASSSSSRSGGSSVPPAIW